jgi:hypothetical protein
VAVSKYMEAMSCVRLNFILFQADGCFRSADAFPERHELRHFKIVWASIHLTPNGGMSNSDDKSIFQQKRRLLLLLNLMVRSV